MRLQEIIQLVRSIPLPEAGDEEELEAEDMDIFSVSPFLKKPSVQSCLLNLMRIGK